MKCKKCNTDINEDIKFCPKCGKKVKSNGKVIIIVISIFILICIVAIIGITKNNSKTNQRNETIEQNSEEFISTEENDYNNEEDYPDFQRTESWYNDPINSGKEVKMPNLVGMSCADLRDYLDNNYLYFITDIEYQYDDSSKAFTLHIPTKIKSTIPEAGTILDPYNDEKIIVLAEYEYGISNMELHFEDTNMESNNFGKTLKIQIGNNENNIIEGIIGEDFYKESRSGSTYLKYSVRKTNNETWWDLIKQKKVACFSRDEVIDNNPNEYMKNYYKIKGKIWIDDELIKETELGILYDRVSLSKY